MAVSEKSFGQSLIPSFLYSSPSSLITRTLPLNNNNNNNNNMLVDQSSLTHPKRSFVIPAPSEPPFTKIEVLIASSMGGALSCGLTHLAFTPLDLAKLNMQIYPEKYKSISSGLGVVFKDQGVRGLFRGSVLALLTYPVYGAFKFGLYDFYKKIYSDGAGPEYAAKYRTLIYLASSISSQVIACYVPSRFEVFKLTAQVKPAYFERFLNSETRGPTQCYILPLWGRQVPYAMLQFASFETIVEMLYKNVIPTSKEQCSNSVQIGVSVVSGYLAGVFSAIVSHPADNLISFLDKNAKAATVRFSFSRGHLADVYCAFSSHPDDYIPRLVNNAKRATICDAIKNVGFRGLFARGLFTHGLPLRMAMIGTLSGAQWGIYDAFKLYVGLPTSGGAAHAAVEL